MSFLQKLFGGGAAAAQTGEDDAVLNAEPIARGRMDLLWLDPPRLAQLEPLIKQHGTITVSMGDGSSLRDNQFTIDDFRWAKSVEAIVDKAFGAAQRGDFQDSIRHYRQALELAPGCDLFLMSIGAGYGQLGQKQRAVRFLERAAQISPGNVRIRQNLENARRL